MNATWLSSAEPQNLGVRSLIAHDLQSRQRALAMITERRTSKAWSDGLSAGVRPTKSNVFVGMPELIERDRTGSKTDYHRAGGSPTTNFPRLADEPPLNSRPSTTEGTPDEELLVQQSASPSPAGPASSANTSSSGWSRWARRCSCPATGLQPHVARRLPQVPARTSVRRHLFHAAAYYGGIGINQTQPATLYYSQPRHGREHHGGRAAGQGEEVRRHRHGVQLSRDTSKAT